MQRKPPLTKEHKLTRLTWAKNRMLWTHEWTEIVFSDEKKWNLDGPDGFCHYWRDLRTEPKIFSKRQCGGSPVMIWAAFGAKGKSTLAFIEDKIKSEDYVEILERHFVGTGFKMTERQWIIQQDNAPIYKSLYTKVE